jgi:hypothetical protein
LENAPENSNQKRSSLKASDQILNPISRSRNWGSDLLLKDKGVLLKLEYRDAGGSLLS